MKPTQLLEVLVLGDEVESILTAVSAARMGATVALVRTTTDPKLGGLSTRGGLAYMDITPELTSPLFQEFLNRAEVIRVALCPKKAHTALSQMLKEANVQVYSDANAKLVLEEKKIEGVCVEGNLLKAQVYIDATPDADFAREAGVPYRKGLGGMLGPKHNFLGITPVFTLEGVSSEALIAFETTLRNRPDCFEVLRRAMPHHPASLIEAYVTRDPICPLEEDYIDILNPAIGVFFHEWRYGTVDTYETSDTWIDGGNIAMLPGGNLSFNGMVTRCVVDTETQITYSQGKVYPEHLYKDMEVFETFLKEKGGIKTAKVVPPQQVYVRQTVNIESKQVLTGERLFSGGVSEEKAIGPYSYWLDFRGINLWEVMPKRLKAVMPLSKPFFNVGLEVAFPKSKTLNNLAVVSRSAGYSPIAQGVCRIVQHNALLGEAIGIAAAIASMQKMDIQEVSIAAISQQMQRRANPPRPLVELKNSDLAIDLKQLSALEAAVDFC